MDKRVRTLFRQPPCDGFRGRFALVWNGSKRHHRTGSYRRRTEMFFPVKRRRFRQSRVLACKGASAKEYFERVSSTRINGSECRFFAIEFSKIGKGGGGWECSVVHFPTNARAYKSTKRYVKTNELVFLDRDGESYNRCPSWRVITDVVWTTRSRYVGGGWLFVRFAGVVRRRRAEAAQLPTRTATTTTRRAITRFTNARDWRLYVHRRRARARGARELTAVRFISFQAGEMEVKNPLFHDDNTPASPNANISKENTAENGVLPTVPVP